MQRLHLAAIVVFGCAVTWICAFAPAVQSITVSEYASLLSFNRSTSVSWIGTEPCFWRGIKCTNSDGTTFIDDPCGEYNVANNCTHDEYHITEIRYTDTSEQLQLKGTLPVSAVSGLSWLRVFILINQGLNGSIPHFTSHPALYHLEIRQTLFSGDLPRIGARDTSISAPYTKIIIIDTIITGISKEAQQPGNAEGFVHVDLSQQNVMSPSPIPSSAYFQFLPSTIEEFICQYCYLEGNLTSLTPERVANLKSVEITPPPSEIVIPGFKGLYGNIAPLFHPTASKLETVILKRHRFTFQIENNFNINAPLKAPALQTLNLEGNQITVLPNMTNLTNLRLLDLHDNPLTMSTSTFFQILPLAGSKLDTLLCVTCHLTGPMPTLSPDQVASLETVVLSN